jgi:hypothetical protein
MTVETSTINALLMAIIALQGWIIRELFKVKGRISIIVSHCGQCTNKGELDTNQITRTK